MHFNIPIFNKLYVAHYYAYKIAKLCGTGHFFTLRYNTLKSFRSAFITFFCLHVLKNNFYLY